MDITSFRLKEFSERADAIYQKIRQELELKYKGKIVAIEPESGDYFLGTDVQEAFEKGRAQHPGKPFHFIRVGYPGVYVKY
ncbi:MAG: hypothetical protein ACK4Z6_03580 [Candidatus Methylomirabilales bacterium]